MFARVRWRARVHLMVTVLVCALAAGCAAPLVDCARDGDMDSVMRRLRNGVHPDRVRRGTTALMYASESGDTAMIRVLLEHGASIDLGNPDDAGMTPLMYAAWGCHHEAVTLLLENGADCHPRRTGYYAADSTRVCKTVFGDTVLTLGLRRGCLPVVQALLEAGADPNVRVVREDVVLGSGLALEWRRVLEADARLALVHSQRGFIGNVVEVQLCGALEIAQGNDELVAILERSGAVASADSVNSSQ